MEKNTFKKLKWLLAVSLTLVAGVNFSACSNDSPMQPGSMSQNATLIKSRAISTRLTDATAASDVGASLQSGSVVLEYRRNKHEYRGGTITLPNGSTLWITGPNYTPPPGHPAGDPVTITMVCERDPVNNELIFTFGPHGSQFDPPAVVEFNWQDLGINAADLYYIDENGNRIRQTPDHIDVQGKTMELSFDHFSRYAVAHSR